MLSRTLCSLISAIIFIMLDATLILCLMPFSDYLMPSPSMPAPPDVHPISLPAAPPPYICRRCFHTHHAITSPFFATRRYFARALSSLMLPAQMICAPPFFDLARRRCRHQTYHYLPLMLLLRSPAPRPPDAPRSLCAMPSVPSLLLRPFFDTFAVCSAMMPFARFSMLLMPASVAIMAKRGASRGKYEGDMAVLLHTEWHETGRQEHA